MTDSKVLSKHLTISRKSEQMVTLHHSEGDEDLTKEKFEHLLHELENIYDNFFS